MAADTKERILDAAEHLFADFGYEATSLRDITSAADVNLASVNYHFGSKDALLSALLERRFAPLNARRIDELDRVETQAGAGRPELEDIVRAFLAPPFEMQEEWGDAGQKFLRLVGRIHGETNDVRSAFIRLFEPVLARFGSAVSRALPNLDEDEVNWRTHFLVGSMAHTMVSCGSFVSKDKKPCDMREVLEALVQFGVAGVSTPSTRSVAVTASRGARR